MEVEVCAKGEHEFLSLKAYCMKSVQILTIVTPCRKLPVRCIKAVEAGLHSWKFISLTQCCHIGVGVSDRGYVALHGTGTPLGDPIEMGALGQALAASKNALTASRLAIGSVKSCYGHSEGAAGLTGTILAVQSLCNQVNLRPLHMFLFELAVWTYNCFKVLIFCF